VGEMVAAAGKKVGVGGNLGLAALDLLALDAESYVLELSSFQLERTSLLNAKAATVLNISADHLDRHADIADYAKQKARVFQGDGVMVINIDDPLVAAMQEVGRDTLTFSSHQKADFWMGDIVGKDYLMQHEKPLMAVSDLPLEGRHNAANALAALALGMAVGLDAAAMCAALKAFKGLEHRMQYVAEIAGVSWVNDSKATNIGACVAALQGYDRKVVLIAGGDAKGADMGELAPAVKAKAGSVILIKQALAGNIPVFKAANMVEAVAIAARIAKPGETVLLSPACASLDQYKNYQDRGNQFMAAVLGLAKGETEILPSTLRVG
jgi:UDP-N-acetylmuramoylalanine--D-glutamate ligase